MTAVTSFLPVRVNAGPFITHYTHAELIKRLGRERVVLPVCSLGTAPETLGQLGAFVLPPLYHEALTPDLTGQIVARVRHCFPFLSGSTRRAAWQGRIDVVELRPAPLPVRPRARVVAFSVDTAVEQHGPHLPLATDMIQSYAVLETLARELDSLAVAPPVDYGQLTWGLPFGMSVDITAPLLTQYVTGFTNALINWLVPEAIYVVDVHGSAVHRAAIQAGLAASRCRVHAFRWLHEPLVEFAGDRGDPHAGGVETALVRQINPALLDSKWWPCLIDDLAAGQMAASLATELSSDLGRFVQHVESQPLNGIVGDIRNFFTLDAPGLMTRMLGVARADVDGLLERCRGTDRVAAER